MKTRIFLVVILMLTILSMFSISYASSDIEDMITEVKTNMSGNTISSSNPIVKGVNVVYTLIRVAGTGISLLMVIILGIKYMMTSVEEKAEIKKQAVPIVVGAGLIFATSNILAMVVKIVEG